MQTDLGPEGLRHQLSPNEPVGPLKGTAWRRRPAMTARSRCPRLRPPAGRQECRIPVPVATSSTVSDASIPATSTTRCAAGSSRAAMSGIVTDGPGGHGKPLDRLASEGERSRTGVARSSARSHGPRRVACRINGHLRSRSPEVDRWTTRHRASDLPTALPLPGRTHLRPRDEQCRELRSMPTTDSRSAQLLLDGNLPLIESLRRRIEHRIRIGGLEDRGSDRTAELTARSLQCGDAHVDEGVDRLEWRRGTISERPNHLFNVVTAALHHGNSQLFLTAREVVVDRAPSSPGPLQDFRESGRRHPMVAVTDLGSIDHALTGVRALPICPYRPSRSAGNTSVVRSRIDSTAYSWGMPNQLVRNPKSVM